MILQEELRKNRQNILRPTPQQQQQQQQPTNQQPQQQQIIPQQLQKQQQSQQQPQQIQLSPQQPQQIKLSPQQPQQIQLSPQQPQQIQQQPQQMQQPPQQSPKIQPSPQQPQQMQQPPQQPPKIQPSPKQPQPQQKESIEGRSEFYLPQLCQQGNWEGIFDFIRKHPNICFVMNGFTVLHYALGIGNENDRNLYRHGGNPLIIDDITCRRASILLRHAPNLAKIADPLTNQLPINHLLNGTLYKRNGNAQQQNPMLIVLLIGEFIKWCPNSLRIPNQKGHLPLHNSILNDCPGQIISLLLSKYTGAASIPDNNGYYPLHIMCARGVTNLVIFNLLLMTSPASILAEPLLVAIASDNPSNKSNDNEQGKKIVKTTLKKLLASSDGPTKQNKIAMIDLEKRIKCLQEAKRSSGNIDTVFEIPAPSTAIGDHSVQQQEHRKFSHEKSSSTSKRQQEQKGDGSWKQRQQKEDASRQVEQQQKEEALRQKEQQQREVLRQKEQQQREEVLRQKEQQQREEASRQIEQQRQKEEVLRQIEQQIRREALRQIEQQKIEETVRKIEQQQKEEALRKIEQQRKEHGTSAHLEEEKQQQQAHAKNPIGIRKDLTPQIVTTTDTYITNAPANNYSFAVDEKAMNKYNALRLVAKEKIDLLHKMGVKKEKLKQLSLETKEVNFNGEPNIEKPILEGLDISTEKKEREEALEEHKKAQEKYEKYKASQRETMRKMYEGKIIHGEMKNSYNAFVKGVYSNYNEELNKTLINHNNIIENIRIKMRRKAIDQEEELEKKLSNSMPDLKKEIDKRIANSAEKMTEIKNAHSAAMKQDRMSYEMKMGELRRRIEEKQKLFYSGEAFDNSSVDSWSSEDEDVEDPAFSLIMKLRGDVSYLENIIDELNQRKSLSSAANVACIYPDEMYQDEIVNVLEIDNDDTHRDDDSNSVDSNEDYGIYARESISIVELNGKYEKQDCVVEEAGETNESLSDFEV